VRIALGLIGIAALTACTPNHPVIEKVASVKRVPGGCELLIRSKWPNMAHDPISFLFRGQSDLNATFKVPALKGTFDAKEVTVMYGGNTRTWPVTHLVGAMSFTDTEVAINFVQIDEGRKSALEFNGKYALLQPDKCTSNLSRQTDAREKRSVRFTSQPRAVALTR
jgi:hypothetical protein